jgi:hypothetical protein
MLVDCARERIEQHDDVAVCCHVPLLGRCVDLVYIIDGDVFTVEFKLRAWRRAIVQARDHRLGADYAYVCMPRREVKQDFRSELDAAGVGLLFFTEEGDWPFETVVSAPRSSEKWDPARRELVSYVENNRGV